MVTEDGRPDPATEAFVRHRNLLFTVAYEMLGSAADAEDVLDDLALGDVGHEPPPPATRAGQHVLEVHPAEQARPVDARTFPLNSDIGVVLGVSGGYKVFTNDPPTEDRALDLALNVRVAIPFDDTYITPQVHAAYATRDDAAVPDLAREAPPFTHDRPGPRSSPAWRCGEQPNRGRRPAAQGAFRTPPDLSPQVTLRRRAAGRDQPGARVEQYAFARFVCGEQLA